MSLRHNFYLYCELRLLDFMFLTNSCFKENVWCETIHLVIKSPFVINIGLMYSIFILVLSETDLAYYEVIKYVLNKQFIPPQINFVYKTFWLSKKITRVLNIDEYRKVRNEFSQNKKKIKTLFRNCLYKLYSYHVMFYK